MVSSTSNNRLDFSLFPQYASYLIENKLEEYVREQIRLSRELNLPVLQYLNTLSEEELIAISTISSRSFLEYFAENRASELIEDSIKQWRADQLPQNIGRYQLSADDLTLISYIRKQSLLKFLTEYSDDITQIMQLIKEVDQYILKSDSAAFETYMNLMDEKINEHLHFIEKIAETSPGIVYVYDLLEDKEIYSNGKIKDVLGFDKSDLEKISWKELQHPEDFERTIHNLEEVKTLSDGDIKTFEHRVKNKKGQFLWLRDYQSIFKRDNEGTPTQIIGLAMDIEKEKQMAQELSNREDQLLEAQSLAEMGSFNWNLLDDQSTSTPQLRKILDLEPGTKLGEFMERIHPYDKRQVEVALDEALKVSGKYDAEFRYLTKGTATEKILWSRGVVSYTDGKPVSMKGTVMDVTERHHMIQRLKRSDELYKQAQALTHIGNWTWDITQNKITWTDELYRIFNLEPQSIEIKFNDLIGYLHPKDKDIFLQSVGQLKRSNPALEYFPRIVLKDGAVKMLSVKTEVLYNDQGEAYKMIGTAQDITQQKLNEKKLRENQNFIQKITDATPSIIAVYNINNGKYLFINQAFEKLLGYSPTDVMDEGIDLFATIVHPDDLPKIMEENKNALELANRNVDSSTNELVVDFKYRMRHKNGDYRWFHTYGTIFDRNEKKQVEHILNISIDITDRINAEKKVIEQEHFIQHIADASPTVLYLFDIAKDSIVYINQEITPVLGYTPDEILNLGSSVKNVLFHPDDQGKIAQTSKRKNEKEFTEYECKMKEKNKGWRCLLIREIGFMKNTEGDYTQVLCAALDISDRKKIEETLYHKTLELQQSNSSLEEFAYVASHDLKEPLRKITTFGDRLLVKEKDVLKEDSLAYLQKIIESSQRMQRMIDDLLSISMISNEKTFEKHDLQIVLNEILQTLEFKIEESKAVINADVLPVANVIPSQFRQLFQNLVSNSLKFSRTDVIPVITIKHKYLSAQEIEHHQLNKTNKLLQITFADNGIGFDEKYSEKIFSIFHRLHGRSEYEGTGIGLAICKKIVENHNGKILATGKENEGATFTIIIPA
ncbi:MAG TPA: PAS domain-containing protein [Segetibacter sp.]